MSNYYQSPVSYFLEDEDTIAHCELFSMGEGVDLAAEWEFEVALDTHSAELSDDSVKTAVLVVDGSELRPLA